MSPFITDTGEIGPCPGCESRDRRKDALEEDIALAQRDALSKMRRISMLERQLADMREEEPEMAAIKEVGDYWVRVLSPRSKFKPAGKRWEKVRARLKDGFTVDRLICAIDGARAFPYQLYEEHFRMEVPRSTRRTDLVYICRDEVTVERLEGYGFRARLGPVGTVASPGLLVQAYLMVWEELREHNVPGPSTLDRVRFLVDEWMAAPEKPQVPELRVVA